jgi:CheY-like chemotaxis protein
MEFAMKTKALVVEDDPRDFATLEEALVSLGHEFVWAKNQFEAERALAEHEFDYVLADLTIPARPQNSKPSPEFCLNFLDNLQKLCGGIPVIVLADREAFAPDMVRDLIDLGAVEFVGKPFSTASRRMSMVISKVLRGDRISIVRSNGRRRGSGESRSFSGGELVLYPDRAELCGVRIITDRGAGQCLMILRQLCKKDGRGRFVRQSSEELAIAIDAPGGASTIAGCVKRIRDNIAQRLKRDMEIECGREDVIQNNWQGYALREWITVHSGRVLSGKCRAQMGSN